MLCTLYKLDLSSWYRNIIELFHSIQLVLTLE